MAPALRAENGPRPRAGRRARAGDDGARCSGSAGGLCAGCCSQGPALARAIAGHGAADDAKWRERREGMRRRNGEGGRVPVCLCACGCCCGCVRARTCAISVHTQTEFQQPHTERLREQSRAEREREREHRRPRRRGAGHGGAASAAMAAACAALGLHVGASPPRCSVGPGAGHALGGPCCSQGKPGGARRLASRASAGALAWAPGMARRTTPKGGGGTEKGSECECPPRKPVS